MQMEMECVNEFAEIFTYHIHFMSLFRNAEWLCFSAENILLKFCIFYTLEEFVPLDCTSDFYIPSRSLRKNRNISWPHYNKGEQLRRISYFQPSTTPFLAYPTSDYVIWNSGLCSSSVLFRKGYWQLTTKFIARKTAKALSQPFTKYFLWQPDVEAVSQHFLSNKPLALSLTFPQTQSLLLEWPHFSPPSVMPTCRWESVHPGLVFAAACLARRSDIFL